MLKSNKIYLFVLLSILPAILFRDFTPSSELRYLSIADEAIREGHIFAFTNHGIPYTDKPPLYLWLIMIAKLIFGHYYMVVLSLFSVIPALVISKTIGHWTEEEYGRVKGRLAEWMFFGNALVIVVMLTIRMDMIMVMFIVLAMRSFFKTYQGRGNTKRATWLFPLYIFLATFTKGPLGLIIPLAITIPFLLIKKRYHDIAKFWGLKTWAILIALFGIWLAATWYEGGKSYVCDLILQQTIYHGILTMHKIKPMWFYAIHIFPTLFPLSFVIVGIAVSDIGRRKTEGDLPTFFAIATTASFIVLSLANSKVDIYLLPVIPFLVTWAAVRLPQPTPNRWIALALYIPAILMALTAVIYPFIVNYSGEKYLHHGAFFTATVIMTIFAILSIVKIKENKIFRAIQLQAIGIYITVFIAGLGVRFINPYIGLGKICNEAKAIADRKGNDTPIYEWDIHRPDGMDVYLGKPAIQINDAAEIRNIKGILITTKDNSEYFNGKKIIEKGDKIVVEM
ncbi:MAG: ArnT family glycosyltransferase [Prevotella sp.]